MLHVIHFLTFKIYIYTFPLPIIFNYSFDNDDMKSSKRHECSFSIVNFLADRVADNVSLNHFLLQILMLS